MAITKTSHRRNRAAAASLRLTLLAGVALGLGITGPAPADTAGTTTPQYQPWSGATTDQLKALIADLKSKIAAAEQSKAASPDFLADLKALEAKFEALQGTLEGAGTTATTAASSSSSAPSGVAAGTQVFADSFADGNYTSNPAWKVSAGTWAVDTLGTHRGLYSKIRPQKLNLNNVLGALLQDQNTASSQKNYASIYTPVAIPNAFTMKVTLTSKDRQGALNLGVYQGASGSTLYRMVYQPGTVPGIAIQKVTPQGAITIGQSSGSLSLEDEKPHDLVFTRDAQGQMTVAVDGKTMANAKDNTITGDMTGLLFINSGGTYYIRSVTVTAG